MSNMGLIAIKYAVFGVFMTKYTFIVITSILLGLNAKAALTIPSQENVLSKYGQRSCNDCKIPHLFQVSVWNMYKGKKPQWQSDYNRLISDSDIILGQEFLVAPPMKESLINPYKRQNILATSFYNKHGQATGVFTNSKVHASHAYAIQSFNREPITNTPKMGLITKYPTDNGGHLTIVNIHALNFVSLNSFYSQVSDLINRVKDLAGPIIFAGDFNTNTPYKTLAMHILFKQAGFTEAKFSGSDDRLTFLGQKLDHIWYRGLILREARVLGFFLGSDHSPMQAEFELID